MIAITVVRDTFRIDERERFEHERVNGWRLSDYMPPDLVPEFTMAIVASPDGLGLVAHPGSGHWVDYSPRDGDELAFVQLEGDPASGVAIAQFVQGTLATLSTEIATLGLRELGQALPSLLGLTSPGINKKRDDFPTFDGVETTAASGIVIPVVFGTHALGGNIISINLRGKLCDDPSEAQKTLLHMVTGLCEGEISDVPTSGIKINGNDITQYLLNGLDHSFNPGSLTQTALDVGITGDDTTTTLAVNLDLLNPATSTDLFDAASGPAPDPDNADEAPLVRQTTTTISIDSYYINIRHTRGLFCVGTFGFEQSDVVWETRYKKDSDPDVPGNWSAWESCYVRGKITGPFVSTSRHEVSEKDVYDIQVRRVTGDRSAGTCEQTDEIRWESVGMSVHDTFRYPGLAHHGMKLEATDDLRGGVPNLSFVIDGFKYERWDGVDPDSPTFVTEFGHNPAWCALAVLRNTRWGIGSYLRNFDDSGNLDNGKVDLVSLKAWADYCDEQVDDGQGTLEDRFRFDGVFAGGETAWSAILRICASARCVPVVVGETIKFKHEHPREPVQLFSMGNIREGSFSVTYKSVAQRPTRYEVKFLNEDADYQPDVVGFDDPEAVEVDLPQIIRTVDLFGVTRQSQAVREARFRLNVEKFLSTIIKFETGVDAIVAEIGDVVAVQHDVPQWGFGGLCRTNASAGQLVIDRDVELDADVSYGVIVQFSADDTIEFRPIDQAPGSYAAGSAISVAANFTTAPTEFDRYSLGRQGIETRMMVITDIVTVNDLTRRIVGVEYDHRIYEDEVDLTPVVATELPDPLETPACPPAPTLEERLVLSQSRGFWNSVIRVSWEIPDDPAVGSSRIYRRNTNPTIPSGFTNTYDLEGTVDFPQSQFFITDDVEVGETYEVVVVNVSPSGQAQNPLNCTGSTITIRNVGLVLPAPATFTLTRSFTTIRLSWAAVSGAESYEIRRGEAWDCSVLVGVVSAPTTSLTTESYAPTSADGGPGEERFHIRAIRLGVYGEPAHITGQTLAPWYSSSGGLTLATFDAAPTWPGAKVNTGVVSSKLVMTITTAGAVGTYTTGIIALSKGAERFRVGAQLWCRAIEHQTSINSWNDRSDTTDTFNSLTQEGFHGPIAPADWPYDVVMEVRFAASGEDITAASWVPFEQPTDVYTSPAIVEMQARLTLSMSGSRWEPQVSEFYITAERVP